MAAGETGQTIGGIAGAAIGSAIPGVGTAVGGAVGQGIGGLIGSGIDRRKADQQTPGFADPLQQQRLNELEQLRKGISTGTNVGTQQAVEEARQIGAQTQNELVKATGGDVGATVSGLLKAQRGTQGAVGQAVAAGQAQLPFFQNLAQQLGTRVSQRKLELGLLGRAQSSAEGAQAGKTAVGTLNALLATQGSLPGQAVNPNVAGNQPAVAATLDQPIPFVGSTGADVKTAPAAAPAATPQVIPSNAAQSLPVGGLGTAGGFGAQDQILGAAQSATQQGFPTINLPFGAFQ